MKASRLTMPRIQMKGIGKSFPGVRALNDVELSLYSGEIHALLGENGAGKSTLVKILTGALQRDDGEVLLEGEPIEINTTNGAADLGISTVYQEVNLVPAMSVTKNLTLGQTAGPFGLISWKKARQQAERKLQRLNLNIDIDQPVGTYSVAIQQLVAIARALDDNTKVLVLDEPTASLDSKETAALFEIVRDLKDNGIAIVFITHFLDQVYEIADRISVLRNGELVRCELASKFSRSDLVSSMIGRDLEKVEVSSDEDRSAELGDVMLSAQDLGSRRALAPTNVSMKKGEVVGIAGLLGSGRTELLKLLFGAIRHDSGSLKLGEEVLSPTTPQKSLRAGLAFCPEDRKIEGLIGELSIRENIVLSMQAKRGWLQRVSNREQTQLADDMIGVLAIATPDAEKPVNQLSGGNQQKVVLARALASSPSILLLDEPTRGIDVGAHAEIIVLIKKLCREGMTLLVASSEIDEIVAVADRVVVLRDKSKVGEVEGKRVTRNNIIEMIAGGHGNER